MSAEHILLISYGLFRWVEISAVVHAVFQDLAIDFYQAGVKALISAHVHINHVGRMYLLTSDYSR